MEKRVLGTKMTGASSQRPSVPKPLKSKADSAKPLKSRDLWEEAEDKAEDKAEDNSRGQIRNLDQLSTSEVERELIGDHSYDDRYKNASLASLLNNHKDKLLPKPEPYVPRRKSHQTKRRSVPFVTEIDLHYLTVEEALKVLEQRIDDLLSRYGYVRLKIITGRGRHSTQGPKIAGHAHGFVTRKYSSNIVKIQESPDASMINNIALRGYFNVELKN